ncbi:MAG: Na+/H+ antiporter subunit D [Streptosporangiales bacterium]|nr:Na+/H+ antiporter subunit D [Streptosporangiales bacterium]
MNLLVPLPVVLPLLASGVLLVARRHVLLQRLLSLAVLGAVTVDAAVLLVAADRGGPLAVQTAGWAAPLSVTLVADRLSALLLLVSSLVVLIVLLYAIGQGVSGTSEAEPTVFHPIYLTLAAGVGLAFLSGDLFNLFVGFEVMLASSYVLLTLSPTRERVRAGMTYTVTSITSSILFLTAIGLCYAAAGTVNLAHLAARMDGLPAGIREALGALLLVVFGVKAAVVPLHFWLPDSYPVALSKITAVFAALLTKVAVYGLIRTQTLLFPREDVSALLLVLAMATLLVGILGALAQEDINRALSFTLVAHIGYMLFGLALFSLAGLAGAILYLVHHILVQAALFLASGLLQRHRGTTSLRSLGGLADDAPRVALLFFAPAMSISGIPPLAGFVAKLGLLQAGLAAGSILAYAAAATAVATSLLTLVVMARIWVTAFWGAPPQADRQAGEQAGGQAGRGPAARVGSTRAVRFGFSLMDGTAMALLIVGLAVAALAGPLSAVSARAADGLLDRTPYRQAVLQEVRS